MKHNGQGINDEETNVRKLLIVRATDYFWNQKSIRNYPESLSGYE